MTINTHVTAGTNPFASRFINDLPFRFDGIGWDALLGRLDALGGRAAIVGPHGSGKTTFMQQLGERLRQEAWTVHHFRTTPESNLLHALAARSFGPRDAVLLDGAGHVGPLKWRRVVGSVRHAGRFVVTAHRPGRLATLHRCEPSLTLLDALIADLAPAQAADLREASHTLFQRHNGNIREVLRGLYDRCAGLS